MRTGGGEHISSKENKFIRDRMRRFLERGFDWIALFLITLIILLTLCFF